MTSSPTPIRGRPARPAARAARVLLCRQAERAGALVELLKAHGVRADVVPLIGVAPPADPAPLEAALADLAAGQFGWLVLTSPNTVDAVLGGRRPPVPAGTRVAAVGPGTAAAVAAAGGRVDFLPPGPRYSAHDLLAAWPRAVADSAGAPAAVLLPASSLADPALADGLRSLGHAVRAVPAYRTVPRPVPAGTVRDLADGRYDAVVVTSGSIARALPPAIHPATAVLCGGAPSARAARETGLRVDAVADSPTDDALAAALLGLLADRTAAAPAPADPTDPIP